MMNKLIHGVGINDVDYIVQPKCNGVQTCCPYYRRWKKLLERVFCTKFKKKNTAYDGVTVCDEWLYFSKFKTWMMSQDWCGNELDKDVLFIGNKHYSPATCCFIPKNLNNLLNQNKSNKGMYPTGVTIDTVRKNRYDARISIDGKNFRIGWFKTPIEASNAYLKKKSKIVKKYAMENDDQRIKQGLLNHSLKFESEVIND